MKFSKKTLQAVVELAKAKATREHEERIKRLEEKVLQMIKRDREREDYAPDEASEQKLAAAIIPTYVDEVGEASFSELKEVMKRFAIDPRHVMRFVKGRSILPRMMRRTHMSDHIDASGIELPRQAIDSGSATIAQGLAEIAAAIREQRTTATVTVQGKSVIEETLNLLRASELNFPGKTRQ